MMQAASSRQQCETTIDGFTFSSKFDSGNAFRFERVNASTESDSDDGNASPYLGSSSSSPLSSRIKQPHHRFAVWVAPDCAGTPHENSNKTWFHFYVKGGRTGQTIQLDIMNMNRQVRLFNQGFKPVVKSVPSKPNWRRIAEKCEVYDGDVFRVSFKHTFEFDDEATYFCFTFPHSFEECQAKLAELDQRYANSNGDVYYHRDILCKSIQGRRVDLITISSRSGITNSREETIDKLFPDQKSERALRFDSNKPVYFLSARVHPGETPSSHVFNGFLDFILDPKDIRAKLLRDNFVFKLIPILNPDGVVNGNYRTDSLGDNLNRFYSNPDPVRHPSIYAAKMVLLQWHREGRLAFYVDLHGHATKRGCFIYGNNIDDFDKQVANLLYPKLVSMNTQHFDYEACNFTTKNMKLKDKRDGLSKEGAGRVAIFLETGLVHCYTLECNYNAGRIVNTLPPLHIPRSLNADKVITPGIPMLNSVPIYTPKILADVGKALAISLLDLYNMNPVSRIPNSVYKSVQGVQQAIENALKHQRFASATSSRLARSASSVSLTPCAADDDDAASSVQPLKASPSSPLSFTARPSVKSEQQRTSGSGSGSGSTSKTKSLLRSSLTTTMKQQEPLAPPSPSPSSSVRSSMPSLPKHTLVLAKPKTNSNSSSSSSSSKKTR